MNLDGTEAHLRMELGGVAVVAAREDRVVAHDDEPFACVRQVRLVGTEMQQGTEEKKNAGAGWG